MRRTAPAGAVSAFGFDRVRRRGLTSFGIECTEIGGRVHHGFWDVAMGDDGRVGGGDGVC